MSFDQQPTNTMTGVLNEMKEVESEIDRLIAKAQQGCVDRGVDPISGKRGKCHVFLDSDICECEDRIDLSKERMK